ncbi:hypothetical protein C8Q80DRAFT_126877 [Daedaleopsis nitida]|nr:hypothetical protein C8Q80DRAFT_126877 [Daedaleopsis nitida]
MASPRRMDFHIPGEITDQIISFVWPDCHSLCACALVRRSWLPASRLHLFYSLDISSGARYDHLLTQVIPSKKLNPWLASVHELRLCGYLDIRVDDPSNGTNDSRRVHRFIHDFAGHLPNLRSLQLVYLDWHLCPPHPSAYLAISRFSLVREVVLNYCEFPSFNVFRRLIVALPSLAELSLKYSSWPSTSNIFPPPAYSQRRPVLTRLRVVSVAGADYVDDLLRWLLQTPSRSAIQDLAFMSISRRRHVSWRHCHMSFLQSMSSSLTSLDIPIVDTAGTQ